MSIKLGGVNEGSQAVFDMSSLQEKAAEKPKTEVQGKERSGEVSKTLELSEFVNKSPSLDELLRFCTDNKCSDLYVKVGQQPFINRWGTIHQVPCFPITAKVWNEWAKEAISSENNSKYVRQKMLDLSYVIVVESEDPLEFPVELRYRVSAGFSTGKNVATFRMITRELPSFKTIKFPSRIVDILHDEWAKKQGIILFVGVTGSGKTTTLAACMNDFSQPGGPINNRTIISLEDPIEYIFPPMSNVNIMQKELGVDFRTFADGVKQSLREHPNFVNVGETRDRETVETLVEAARTGHSVVSSFHASDVGDTIARMYNMLIGQNEGIMYDVISNMNFVLCQRLLPSDNGFRLETQWMRFTDGIKNHLNEKMAEGENIPMTIAGLFKDQKLVQDGVLQDWK